MSKRNECVGKIGLVILMMLSTAACGKIDPGVSQSSAVAADNGIKNDNGIVNASNIDQTSSRMLSQTRIASTLNEAKSRTDLFFSAMSVSQHARQALVAAQSAGASPAAALDLKQLEPQILQAIDDHAAIIKQIIGAAAPQAVSALQSLIDRLMALDPAALSDQQAALVDVDIDILNELIKVLS